MAYGCRLGYNENQTGCHVEPIHRSSSAGRLVPGDLTIKTIWTTISKLSKWSI